MLPPLSGLNCGMGWRPEVPWAERHGHEYLAVLMPDGRAVPHVLLRVGDWTYVLDCRPEEFETQGALVMSWPALVRLVNSGETK